MRRLIACLILGLALAAPASAKPGRATVVEPAPALRGTVGATPRPAPEDAPLLLPLPAQPTSLSSSSTSGSQCRTACSQQYYFCLAGEDDNCPQYWSRCVSGCGG